MCKDFGDLGIPNFRNLNICLLPSWLKRYNKDSTELWKELVDYKYRKLVILKISSPILQGASSFLRVLYGPFKQLRWLQMGDRQWKQSEVLGI